MKIRTPLNSVIGFSDMLQKTHLDETQKLYNTAVFQSANSLLDIITEILDFSKSKLGKLEIDISKTNLHELAYSVN
jgi:signal transduction histidine kinase